MRPHTETEINERLERSSCVLDRLSRGLLEITRKRSHEIDGHNYISLKCSFSAAVPATTLYVNAREVPMKPIRSFDRTDTENSPTISAPKAIVSVWLIFLYGVVEGYYWPVPPTTQHIDFLRGS